MRRQPQLHALGAIEPSPGQREELREPPAKPRQIASPADVGENADRRFRHRQDRPLSRDAEAAGAGDTNAAAHGNAVHEGDARLGVGIFEVVEAIFVEEEGTRRILMPVDALGDGDDVAAGAEAAALRMVDEDDADIGVVPPFDQGPGHVAHHLPIEAVQCLGAIEAQAAGEAFLDGQHVLLGRGHVHHCIFA